MLEPSHHQRARQAPTQTPGRGAQPADEDPVRRDARGGGAAEARVSKLVYQTRPRGGRAGARSGLGADGDVLPVPVRALEAPADVDPVESPFAAVRLRTAAAKRFKKVENATAVIWKTLLIAEKTFRRLDAPALLAEVANGVVYVNGVRAMNRGEHKAAA